MKFLYEVFLLASLLLCKKRSHHIKRLFGSIPNSQAKPVIWIHAVSVGEAKAAQHVLRMLRAAHPSYFFLITTVTEAGLEEARKSLPSADAYCYLPIDIRWIVNRWVKKLKPKLFLMIEGDVWPQLLKTIQKRGGKTALISGKLSTRSAKWFAAFPFFAKKLFKHLDLICVQNEEYRKRFFPFVNKQSLHIGKNLKLDLQAQVIDFAFWQKFFPNPLLAITLSCTHFPEEEKLLRILPLQKIFLFLAPRHPERFEDIAHLLQKEKIPFVRWSKLFSKQDISPQQIRSQIDTARVLLVDAMGQLPICYSLSCLAILGGSFENQFKGHNILEPCLYGAPVFFGMHMPAQQEFSHLVLSAKAGKQVSYDSLRDAIDQFLANDSEKMLLRDAAKFLVTSCGGAAEQTVKLLTEQLFNRPL